MFRKATTPEHISQRVKDWCKAFAGSEPFYVNTGNGPPTFCHLNAASESIRTGADIVPGWVIWEGGFILEAECHSIILLDGNYIDPTRQEDGELRVLFVPDVKNNPSFFQGENIFSYHNLIFPKKKPERSIRRVLRTDLNFHIVGKLDPESEMSKKILMVSDSLK